MAATTRPTVSGHFAGREPAVQATYDKLLAAARRLGTVREEAKQTSIHLVRETAFAGVATRKAVLLLTLKADADIRSPRIAKHEQTSAHRWHLELRLASPADVDRELLGWLRKAWELSG